MNRIPLAKKAVALPLLGLLVAWLAFMGAALADLYVPFPTYDNMGNAVFADETFHVAPYLYLLGISAAAVCSLIAQRWSIRARKENGEAHKLSLASFRFANLGIVLGLAAGTIFAIGTFMGAFNSYSGRNENILLNLLNTYVPILLATGLVVYVVLAAFVFEHQEKNTDGTKQKMSAAQKALGLGYAVPILSTAAAIIFGLVVYDVTRTNLQVWIWVIIIAIVAAGVVFGTRFANKAKSIKPAPPKQRTALAAGAANLNFVLSIVFGATVSIMAFTFGSSAIQKLQVWSNPPIDCKLNECISIPTVTGPTWQWLFEELAPAKVLLVLAVVGIYVTITERNKETAQSKKVA